MDQKDSTRKQIPLIDFSQFIAKNASPSDRLKVAQELVLACHTVGFVYIKNHGMSPKVLERSFAAAKQFYDLPQHERMHVKVPEDSLNFYGYSWPGREKASRQNNGEYYNGPKDPEDLMALNVRYTKWPGAFGKLSNDTPGSVYNRCG
jgi:isopenicillin N synthase-like dioxygenase